MRSLLTVRKILCLDFMTCVACSCRATHEEIKYDSDSSVSDSGNSFENENEKHSAIPTASGTEILFLIGGRPKFGRPVRYKSKFSLKSELVS